MIPRASIPILLAAGVAAAALAGCGRQAHLQRPQPLAAAGKTGELSRQAAATRARVDAAERAQPRAPQSFEEVRDQGLPPRDRTDIPASSDPNPPRPGSILPSPLTNPQSPQ